MEILFSDSAISKVNADLVAVVVCAKDDAWLSELDDMLGGHLLEWCTAQHFRGERGSSIVVPTLGHISSKALVLIGAGTGSDDELRHAAGCAGSKARDVGAEHLALYLGDVSAELLQSALECVGAGNYRFDRYKKEDSCKRSLVRTTLLCAQPAGASDIIRSSNIRTQWQGVARDLVNLPAADIYPESLASHARDLSRLDGVTVEVWDADRCQAEGCVGIVAVGQGSAKPGCLIHIRYRPPHAKRHIALVGKGVTFDSGGLSLKPSNGMQTMRCDMAGAATMLAATGAIAELGLPIEVDTFLGAVENMTSGNAYKLGDVLRYANGVTVEVHNTDAEGRLVLADCLIQACQVEGVTHVVDAATLTGACVVAIGEDFTGVFTESDDLASQLISSANENGEGMWRLPLHAPYKRLLKATWAQIKNVGGRDAGATTAALFLQHFVSDVEWAHLDIAGAAFCNKANGFYEAGGTGQIVRSLTTWAETMANGN